MNVAMILAGGVGSRMKADRPKQFIEVMGKPVIVWTLEKFQAHAEIDMIEVVCVQSHLNALKSLIKEYGIGKAQMVIPGGNTYQGSVMNGLAALNGICKAGDIVVTHMAASPMVGAELISDSIRVCRGHGNAISCNDMTLCIGLRDDDGVSTREGIDRDTIAGLNTPQSLEYAYFRDLYDRAKRRGALDRIDPHITSLFYEMGEPMFFSKGSSLNLKLTTQDDIELFRAYLSLEERRKGVEL